MPELPEVEVLRRELAPVLEGAYLSRVLLRRPDLRRPFPHDFEVRLAGAAILRLRRRAKYLLADLSSGDTVLMHLGMSGWFRVEDAGHVPAAHDHVRFDLSSGRAVVFNDPRRFGVMDLASTSEIERIAALADLGPEPLSDDFDAAALAAACAGSRRPIKVALLDQRVVAGIGNIYASEALHVARLSPRMPAARLAHADGAPTPAAHRLAAAIKSVLVRAIHQLEADTETQRFRVYDRAGKRCLRRGCGGTIRRLTQAGRSTFYCPVCQPMARRARALRSSRAKRRR
jgi:formamidopyrimidine-DNA glycosylase